MPTLIKPPTDGSWPTTSPVTVGPKVPVSHFEAQEVFLAGERIGEISTYIATPLSRGTGVVRRTPSKRRVWVAGRPVNPLRTRFLDTQREAVRAVLESHLAETPQAAQHDR